MASSFFLEPNMMDSGGVRYARREEAEELMLVMDRRLQIRAGYPRAYISGRAKSNHHQTKVSWLSKCCPCRVVPASWTVHQDPQWIAVEKQG
jgi:hypothetical protein